jgi:hypothetical protein
MIALTATKNETIALKIYCSREGGEYMRQQEILDRFLWGTNGSVFRKVRHMNREL